MNGEIKHVQRLEPKTPDINHNDIEELKEAFEKYLDDIDEYVKAVNNLVSKLQKNKN